jgi:branched-chain amino acid transport system ATP-binding protein
VSASDLLNVSGLFAGYGRVDVLKDISISVSAGEIITVIGSNGAGKTTLLRALSGLIPHRGRIEFNGSVLEDIPAHELVPRGLIHVPEGRKIFPRLTVRENLELGAFVYSGDAQTREDIERAYAMFPILKERSSQLGGTLSGGEQQMLAIARGLMSRPKLLLLDEPSMGVAPKIVERIFESIVALNRDGLSILLVEQNSNLALKVAHRGYVLEMGEVTLTGGARELAQDPRMLEAYLG